jgi:hypothetical protein
MRRRRQEEVNQKTRARKTKTMKMQKMAAQEKK